MNKVILIGRLTRDPELRYTPGNMPVTNITVAINRPVNSQTGEKLTDFIGVSVFGKTAENVCKYLAKGRLVAIEGRIQTRNYEGADGKRVYATDIIASNVQFLESKTSQASGNSYPTNFSNTPTTPSINNVNPYDFVPNNETMNVENDPFENFGTSIELSDDELPFN